jgi:acid phosphatase
MNDIMYFYNTGYGNPTSGYIGFPWLNETMSLLSSNDNSSSSQDIYVSFTHREMPPTVLVAMGLFNNTDFIGGNPNNSMPLDRINYNRAWVSSYILPFLTNIAIEKLDCSARSSPYNDVSNSSSTYYRVLVNDSPQTLPGCYDGPSESCSEDGLQSWLAERGAMFGGFSAACNTTGSYSNSTDAVTFYTSGQNGTFVGKRTR